MRKIEKLESQAAKPVSKPSLIVRGKNFLARYELRNSGEGKKVAFTLAEVLITLAIIGVVAALTIPTLISKMSERAANARKDTIEARLLDGINRYSTLEDGLSKPYETTYDFLVGLSKHYKMAQICGANDLQNCFPYSTINYTDDNGDATINVTDLKTAENFKLSSDDYLAPAGFISAQGTPFVMLLKKDCVRDTGEAMRSIPTSCIQYIYDRNGANNPNKLGTDIIHSASIGLATTSSGGGESSSKVAPDGTLATPIGSYTTYLILNYDYQGGDGVENGLDTCDGSDDIEWDTRGSSNSNCNNNRWAAAKKACSDAGYELPSKQSLQELYCRAKGKKNSYYSCSNTNLDNDLAVAISNKASITGIYFYSNGRGTGVCFDNGNGCSAPNQEATRYRVICME